MYLPSEPFHFTTINGVYLGQPSSTIQRRSLKLTDVYTNKVFLVC